MRNVTPTLDSKWAIGRVDTSYRTEVQWGGSKADYYRVSTEDGSRALIDKSLSRTIARYGLPWHVARVGARVEFVCAPGPLKNGGEAEAAHAPELEAAIHVSLVNGGILIAPFHNMMLVSPVTDKTQVDRLAAAFGDIAERLAA